MQGMRFAVAVHVTGTTAADLQGQFTLPCGATLTEISFCNSAAADGTISCGPSTDTDGICALVAVGDSGTPNVIEPADFNGDLADQIAGYHMANDTVFQWSMVFGDVIGTAMDDVTAVFWFTEG